MKAGRIRVLALMAADLVCIYGCWLLALWGYRAVGFGYYKFGLEFYFRLWPVGLTFVLINALFRVYHGNPCYPGAAVPPHEELRRLVASSLLTHLGLIAFLAFARQTTVGYSRFAMSAAGVLTAFSVQPLRDLLRLGLHRLGVAQLPVRVVGEPARAAAVAAQLSADAYAGLRPVASGEAPEPEILVVARADDPLSSAPPDRADRYMYVEWMSSDGLAPVERVNERRMAAVRAEKRVLDAVLAVLAFVLLSPLFLLIPVLIRLTSRGPVFYRQARLGKRGRPMRVWKFRSMYVDAEDRLNRILSADPVRRAEWERNFKLVRDPRVTPLGRFLRKTSLDEIPQLFNVFAGEMALVGPRPIVADEVAYYGGRYETFASVRPGVTGLWQVSGRSGTGYDRRVELDTYYVRNWSPWLDLWILRRTLGAVLLMRGAC